MVLNDTAIRPVDVRDAPSPTCMVIGKYMTNLSSKGASFIIGLQGIVFFKKEFFVYLWKPNRPA